MSKVFNFSDDSEWEYTACDCCQGYHWEMYNSDDTDPNLGTAYCVEECYVQAILTVIGREDEDEIWEKGLDELKALAKELDIIVKIEGEEV